MADYSHGVQYTPSTIFRSPQPTLQTIKDLGISYIRVQWVDLANDIKCRVIPVSYIVRMLDSPRPSIAMGKVCMDLVYMTIAPDFTVVGEYLYVLDMSTLKICPYAPGEASVMGWFQEKSPVPRPDGSLSVDVDLCPRGALRRVTQMSFNAGVEFLVGFESEFTLLKGTNPVEAVNTHSWTTTNAFPPGSVQALVLKEIADGIQASGIELQMYHAEAAPGQYEMVTGPLPPLESVDALVHTREIITNTAAKHGLRATFAPRVFKNSAGTSTHAHISVHSKDCVKLKDKLSLCEESFLASILVNLPALTALTLPIPASYQRVVDGLWTGGTYVCWGTENRDVPIRLTNAAFPSSRNFELRFLDGTANPYLALAGIIGLGYTGIRDKLELTVQDCPGPQTAVQMGEAARKRLSITKRMSLTLEESHSNLKSNAPLRDIFGSDFIEKYLSVNKTLADALTDGDDESDILRRLVEFY